MRPLVAVAVSALIAALLVPVQHVAAQADGYTVTPGLLETTTGPGDDMPVTLDYDLYLPDTASAATPAEAIVLAHGFGNAKDVNEMTALAGMFATHGYVVLASTHQGFGGSSGCIALDSADYDAKNVSRLIDLLAARPDVRQEAPGDPVVGMVGGSYGGGHQGAVAAQDPRVDALSPGRTWHSLQYALDPNNIATDGLDHYEQGVFKQGWTSLFFAAGSATPVMGDGGCDPVTQQTLYPGQPPCPGFDPVVCPINARLTLTGDASAEDRAVIARSSMATFVDQVDVPVLLTQGQSDTLFTLNEAIATFTALRARGVDARMIWNHGGHGYPAQPGEGEPYTGTFDASPESQAVFQQTYFAQRYLGFFGHVLRGDGDPGPVFAWYRDWVDYDVAATGGTAAPAYASASTFPVGGVQPYLLDAASGGLLLGTPEAATATIFNPPQGEPAAYSELPNFSAPGGEGDRPPTELPGQHVMFTTAPFEQAVESVGMPTATLQLANANGQDAVLFAKVYDVAPDGSATLIRRLVAAVRVPAAQLPGPIEIRLAAFAHRFEAGHAARLLVATTDASYRNATVADEITIVTGGEAASIFRLPVDNADTVRRVAGPDRVATGVAVAQEAFASAQAVVLARADAFADALVSGPLAAQVGGPVLLTASDELDARVLAEIDRLGAQVAYLAGGESALGPGVAQALADNGVEVRRVAGADRAGTAAAMAREVVRLGGPVSTAVLARGDDFADALAAGSLAALLRAPILLTERDALPAATSAAIGELVPADGEVLVAGGSAAIADATVAATGRTTRRLAGADRYATARALADEALRDGADPEPVLLASGADFPDALAAVPAAHALGGLLLLVDPTDLERSVPTREFLDAHAATITTALIVGGPAALSAAVEVQVATATR